MYVFALDTNKCMLLCNSLTATSPPILSATCDIHVASQGLVPQPIRGAVEPL